MSERRRRADAVDNRERILESARRLLAADSDVKLNAVAKAAGVGQGTLYRHFPSRVALLVEVYRADVEKLGSSAERLLARTDAATALRTWFDEVADYARVKHGVLVALSVDTGHELTTKHAGTLARAIEVLLAAGRNDGTIRHDIDSREVLLLLGFLSRVDGDVTAERVHRALDVIVDGLRASR
ncbi:TetR/AcrR family transcriptional regulator [Pseudonocardia sp. KRD291]|uniref:TetR/AcrR family transcriptional regulator n=1 Tax=Pseudonocardia sp. KRD291 TaxID=2792007 RepID=UPI001C49F629|nr:TetR/AcrR family transcriptional regulator [Pseudonocardia sp. KRD291]MBW0105361.1 TetR/AcrR family transcriptional regulator [Pseudonocardia sp. KRD291]